MADPAPEGFIVRIAGPDGRAGGMGVLIASDRVLTCAHVVNAALGLDSGSQPRPDGRLSIDFPLLPGSPADSPVQAGSQVVTATVDRWLPPPRETVTGDDLATLVLAGAVPSGARPARLIANPPRPGRPVRVYGYPGSPPRPDGAWVPATVRGQVGNGRVQLDSGPEAALRIQPGYSGSPVIDDDAGRVIGLLVTAAAGRSAERDSYAVGTEALRRAWPDRHRSRRITIDSGGGRSLSTHVPQAQLTVLHVSDPQFGRLHLFGGNGNALGDRDRESLLTRLHDDLERLALERDLRPDLMVVTGDLAESGRPSEFAQAAEFLGRLTEAVELPRRHVAVVPGNHDVNLAACRAYFAERESDEQPPVPPYWPKWRQFSAMFEEFYADVPGVTFTPDEPWTLFEMPELNVVIAGLNSTLAESHLDADHHGWVGEQQLRWFADRLAPYRDRKWLRLAAVHHNAVRGSALEGENLRDADQLDRLLGDSGLVNLVLHGHPRDGRPGRLPSGLITLATGSAAVPESDRAAETPNQYQLISLRPEGFTRYARQYVVNQHRWIGDGRISAGGSDWVDEQPARLSSVGAALATAEPEPVRTGLEPSSITRLPPESRPPSPPDGFFAQVADATRAGWPQSVVTERPEAAYLRVSHQLAPGGAEQWPVGVIAGEPTEQAIREFAAGAHAQFATADPLVQSRLVHGGLRAPEPLVILARRNGIRLLSFIEYQGLLDLTPLVDRQHHRLTGDRIYPAALYVPQRYRMLAGSAGRTTEQPVLTDLLDQVTSWLAAAEARLVMVLGDFGRGKTSLLRQLSRTLPDELPGVLPILVELRSLEKAPTLDGLLAQHLANQGVTDIHLGKLRYMMESGRLALLFDGFDELELRVGYDNATDYLQTLLASVKDRAKVVLTSRTQHFLSTEQLRTALGERVDNLSSSRVVVLEDFSPEQILRFLTNLYDGDTARAQTRFDLLGDIEDLLGLARNPRMLAFIAALDEDRLRAVQREQGRISAAELYREIVDFWLVGEADRQRHRSGVPSFDEKERLAACTALALRLWSSTALTIAAADLSAEVAGRLDRLAERGYSADQAGHAIGSGSLLVRTEDGGFGFVHQSIMEWLVAAEAARALTGDAVPSITGIRPMSRLMTDFFIDLAGGRAPSWANGVLVDTGATDIAKQNALAVRNRLRFDTDDAVVILPFPAREVSEQPSGAGRQVQLAGVDLRSQDLAGTTFANADLRGANLSGMHLLNVDFTGADLRDADFSDSRLVGGSLHNAQLAGSDWSRSALTGVGTATSSAEIPELRKAAVTGRDPADPMLRAAGFVSDVAFSPDGRLLATARASVVEIVQLADGRALRVLAERVATVNSVAFSPDGALLAAGSDDGTATLYAVDTGTVEHVLSGHAGRVRAVAFSPDGTSIATASDDCTTRIWDLTGTLRTVLTGHAEAVVDVAFSSDGALVATASDDGTARIWNATTGARQAVLDGHLDRVTAVAFVPGDALQISTPDLTAFDRMIATASADRTTRIWSIATGVEHTALRGHTSGVKDLAFSPDGTTIATASIGGTLRIWDVATGAQLPRFSDSRGPLSAVAISPDGRLVALASAESAVWLWDIATGTEHLTLTGRQGSLNDLAFSPDGRSLATASTDHTTRIWDVATGSLRTALASRSGVTSDVVSGIAFSRDGLLIATASGSGTARIWDASTGTVRFSLTGRDGGMLHAVTFSPDSRLIATAASDRTARVWDTATGRHLLILPEHSGDVRALAFSPDNQSLATASGDLAWIWNLSTSSRTAAQGHTGDVNAVAYSPGGRSLATASSDHTARIWDTTTESHRLSHRLTINAHQAPVKALAYSPDGTLIATASADGTARLWDAATGEPRSTFRGHTAGLSAVAFSPDGTLIATACDDDTARIWDVSAALTVMTLLHLGAGSSAALFADGSYQLDNVTPDQLWWAIKLCRFDPGELDPYVPQIRRRLPPRSAL